MHYRLNAKEVLFGVSVEKFHITPTYGKKFDLQAGHALDCLM